MRLLLSVALLVGGAGFCLLNSVAHVMVVSGATSGYYRHMESVPLKDSYTRAEMADSMWQVWTNRLSLPAQSTYTVEELKAALLGSAYVIGSSQESSDRRGLDHAVRNAAGLGRRTEPGMTIAGVLVMLAGAFVFGTTVGKKPEAIKREKVE